MGGVWGGALKVNFKLQSGRPFPGVRKGREARNSCLVRLAIAQVARLLVSVDVPDDVVGQSDDLVAGTLSHLGESFCFGLVLKGIRGEVDAGSVDIGLDEDVDTTDTIELNLLVLVLAPVTHADQVGTASVILLVTFGEDSVGVESGTKAAGLVRVDPRVVVDYKNKVRIWKSRVDHPKVANNIQRPSMSRPSR